MPSHLDQVNLLEMFEPRGFAGIDVVHRQGQIHTGSFMYVFDSSIDVTDPKLLLLKREKHLVTCPGTWSILGEHTYRDEPSIETVYRGILEELGSGALRYLKKHGSVSNLTEFPVYYERDYGPSNGGRIDRQLTYFWMIEMNTHINQLYYAIGRKANGHLIENLLQFDDEVADHKWVSLDELTEMLNDNNREETFCHHTIVSLTKFGLDRLLELRKMNTNRVIWST